MLTNNLLKHENQILVIEDNADQWFLTRWALLQTFPEITAIWKSNLFEAIAYLEASLESHSLPRLILLDLYLPQREIGWKILETIKTHFILRDIPIIVLSFSDDKDDIKETYMFRANSYIIKPATHKEWLECFHLIQQYWSKTVTLPAS